MRLFVYLFVLAVLHNCFAIPIPSGHQPQPGSSRQFICRKGCNRSFEKSGPRKRHELTHTVPAGSFVCKHDGCQHRSNTPAGRTNHESTHTPNSFPCGHNGCTETFPDIEKKKMHAKTHWHSELWLPVGLNDNSPLHRKKERNKDVFNMWCEVPGRELETSYEFKYASVLCDFCCSTFSVSDDTLRTADNRQSEHDPATEKSSEVITHVQECSVCSGPFTADKLSEHEATEMHQYFVIFVVQHSVCLTVLIKDSTCAFAGAGASRPSGCSPNA